MTSQKPLFLTTKQAAEMMGIAQVAFQQVMRDHGIAPVDFGRGARRGLRWRTDECIRIADVLQAEANRNQQNARARGRRKSALRTESPLWGKSVAQLFAELSAPTQ